MAAPASGSEPPVQIPHLVKDATWSLQPWPVEVNIAGIECEIPAMFASEWLVLFMGPHEMDLDEVFPGLLPPDQAELVEEALFEEKIDLDSLARTALDVISTVAGRPWHVALKIIGTAEGSWNALGGELVIRNIDASRLSLGAWLDAVYLTLIRNMDNKQAMMFNAKLQVPPPGFEEPESGPELDAESFMAMDLG